MPEGVCSGTKPKARRSASAVRSRWATGVMAATVFTSIKLLEVPIWVQRGVAFIVSVV